MKNKDWHIDIFVILIGIVFVTGYINSRNKYNEIKEYQTIINNLEWRIRSLNATIRHQRDTRDDKDSLKNYK